MSGRVLRLITMSVGGVHLELPSGYRQIGLLMITEGWLHGYNHSKQYILKPIFFNQPSIFSNLLSFFVLSVLFYAHDQLCSL